MGEGLSEAACGRGRLCCVCREGQGLGVFEGVVGVAGGRLRGNRGGVAWPAPGASERGGSAGLGVEYVRNLGRALSLEDELR